MSSGFFRYFIAVALIFILTACGGGGGSSSNPSGSTGAVPVASAGLDQNVTTSSVVTLDGSASTAPDGSLLSYIWVIVSKPEGSQSSLSNPLAVKPTFVTDRAGIYVIALVVTTGSKESQESFVTVTAATGNSIPVANAGTTQSVAAGSLVTLDGTTSSDADSALLVYAWSFVTKPAGSTAVLSDAAAAKPTFTPDVTGDYVLNLVVNDGTSDSEAVEVTVTAGTANSAPVANAGANQGVATESLVTLDGDDSSDADSDPLTYSWSFVSRPVGSSAALSTSTVANPNFAADLDGEYVLRLVVNDGKVDSSAATVTVTAATANSAPVANAGVNQNVATGSLVTLDGSDSSDANSDPLTYSWSFVSKPVGSAATLSSATAAKPTFTADMAGDYVLRLVVNDGKVVSSPATVTVTAATANSAPVANAGANQNIATGSLVTLDGSDSSDADSDPLTYSWSFISKPVGSTAVFSSATAAKPTFIADMAGEYVLRLVVNDGKVVSTAANVTVAVATANSAPTANAGADQNVATGSLVTLDGSGSSDADDDSLTYAWSFVSKPVGSAAEISNVAVAKPTFTADVDGNYVLRLMVNDGTAYSVADTLTVTAATANSAPVANTGADQNVATGSLVTLDGSGSSDADSDTLTYAWTFSSKPVGSNATFSSASAAKPTFTADVDGDFVIRLIVNDGKIASAAATVTVAAFGPGSLKWKIYRGNIYDTPVLALDGTIYIANNSDSLFAINPNGTTKWERTVNYSQPTPPAVGKDGTLYIGNGNGFLRALNPADGSELWALSINGISMPELGQDGSIYVTSSTKALYAINSDGTIQWTLEGYYTGRPSVGADGTVYVSSWRGLAAINQDGTPKWEYSFFTGTAGQVVFGPDGTLYVNGFYRYLNKVELGAINPDGSLKWIFDSDGWAQGVPALDASGTIYIGSRVGNLYAVNADGSLKWSFITARYQDMNSPAIGSDGTIYVGAKDSGYLYAIDPSGNERWKFLTNTNYSAPAIENAGTIYFGVMGTLYSIYGP